MIDVVLHVVIIESTSSTQVANINFQLKLHYEKCENGMLGPVGLLCI